MAKLQRLSKLNEVIAWAKTMGIGVGDVHFGLSYDTVVVMRGSMPQGLRQHFQVNKALDYALVDYDPHFPGWASYHEALYDRDARVAIIFPRPADQLEAHKAELRARLGLQPPRRAQAGVRNQPA